MIIAAAIFAMLAAGIFVGSIMEYNSLLRQKDAVELEILSVEERNEKYKHDISATIDDKYIESVAKDKLNLINPDEIIIHGEAGK